MKGQQTRDRILEAATKVVAKKGIENASVTWIAKEAKVSRGLVIYYIPDTANLLLELIRFIAAKAYTYFLNEPDIKGVSEIYQSRIPFTVISRVEKNFGFFKEHPHYFQCFMLFYYRSSYDSVCRKMNNTFVETAINEFVIAGDKTKAESVYMMMFAYIQKFFILDVKEKRLSDQHLNRIKAEFYHFYLSLN